MIMLEEEHKKKELLVLKNYMVKRYENCVDLIKAFNISSDNHELKEMIEDIHKIEREIKMLDDKYKRENYD